MEGDIGSDWGPPMTPQEFIDRWRDSGGAELANSQSFLKELCAVLDVPQPEPAKPDGSQNTYVFEKAVEFNNGDGTTSAGRVGLYRKGCFVLESKQGVERKAAEQAQALATKTKTKKFHAGTAKRGTPGWEHAMVKARQQAKRYAEALPDEWPPFLVVVDVGYCFDLYADFTQSGKNYVPFPDPQSYRIRLPELENEPVRQTLCAIWQDPPSLDPSRLSARVTRHLAERLAKLARSLEQEHPPDVVAQFLMRCLFTMFAEDVELGGFSTGCFTRFLEARRDKLDTFVPMLSRLWEEMDTGGFSVVLEGQLQQFNGGLFEDHTALPVTEDQLELLIEAAEAQWNDVEPAIFGTLLERALDPVERHKLGAHYTPRAYVERLVMPTIIEPLREQWDTAYATAVSQHEDGKASDAIKTVRQFHEQLCESRVLDPACGSGNFLYVSLELMKRLEGEVLKALRDFGDRQQVLLTIDPHQFLGIEVNPRAAAIADLVLWIGYLQWHFRTRGKDPLNEPIIRKFHNIECRDAVLAWDAIEPVVDDNGTPVTRWDGRTTKPHPVTGKEVPDEAARVQELRYINPRKAEWPKADYVVGNPPFVGSQFMLEALGRGYVSTLRETYSTVVPQSADLVMYWWQKGAHLVGTRNVERCGLITTNSLKQSFNSRIVASALTANPPVSLVFAVHDHPWVQSEDGAAVRICMTVVTAGRDVVGQLLSITSEKRTGQLEHEVGFAIQPGVIRPNLRIGVDLQSAKPLESNRDLSFMGVKLVGGDFVITEQQALVWQTLGNLIRPFLNGRDITQRPRGSYVIDPFSLSCDELRETAPSVYQHIYDHVKPARDARRGKSKDADEYADRWWQHAKPRPEMRASLNGLDRYIATSEVSKHRFFVFVDSTVLADGALIAIALSHAYSLGVLSSRPHVIWTLGVGGTLEDRPRYNKTRCFDPFPFPSCDTLTTERIRKLGEQLDGHRKRQQELFPDLTVTGMYNVLEKLRAAERYDGPPRPSNAAGETSDGLGGPSYELTAKEREIHEKGLVSVLKQIHDDLDVAVFDAYGWPHDLDDEQILQRLVDLNHQRAAEEARGHIRWLRPDFQNPDGQQQTQTQLGIGETEQKEKPVKPAAAKAKKQKQKWPSSLPERVSAVRTALADHAAAATPAEIAKYFSRARKTVVEELLDTLVTVGQARQTDDGRYVL